MTKQITLTLDEFDWLRIRAALIRDAQELSKKNSDQEEQYFKTYITVKNSLKPFFQ